METDRFDEIARLLRGAPTRRGLTQLVSAGVLAAAGWRAVADTAAKGKKKKKKKKCKPQCDKECQICNLQKGTCKSLADGKPCDSADICEDGECVPFRCGNGGPCTVFVTNAGKVGSATGGLNGADAFCQSTAEDANLSGTFRAWLSAGNASPSNRFSNRNQAGPYRLVPIPGDGGNPPPTVAASFADLISCDGGTGLCLQHAIDRTEDGFVLSGGIGVWTGTLANGTTAADTCGGWTSAGTGLTGNATAENDEWTDINSADCQFDFRFYCFEQA